MYSLLTSTSLARGFDVSRSGYLNPGHEQLQQIVKHQLMNASDHISTEAKRASRRLLIARRVADYQPALTHGSAESLSALRDLASVQKWSERGGAS